MNEVAILRKYQVEELTGRSYSSIRRDMARGDFPKPVQIGPRAIGWRSQEVRAWLESRTTASLPPVGRQKSSPA
jgi:prophage regulatory protein